MLSPPATMVREVRGLGMNRPGMSGTFGKETGNEAKRLS